MDLAPPRAVVEVDQDELLPGPQDEPAGHQRARVSDGPTSDARRCACALSSSLQDVVLVVAAPRARGTSRSSSARRSATPPGSYSIVVTAAVEPVTNTRHDPVRDAALAHDARARPR